MEGGPTPITPCHRDSGYAQRPSLARSRRSPAPGDGAKIVEFMGFLKKAPAGAIPGTSKILNKANHMHQTEGGAFILSSYPSFADRDPQVNKPDSRCSSVEFHAGLQCEETHFSPTSTEFVVVPGTLRKIIDVPKVFRTIRIKCWREIKIFDLLFLNSSEKQNSILIAIHRTGGGLFIQWVLWRQDKLQFELHLTVSNL